MALGEGPEWDVGINSEDLPSVRMEQTSGKHRPWDGIVINDLYEYHRGQCGLVIKE